MNETIACILNRRSVRAFEPRQVPDEIKQELLLATMRAPTAGNLMLYSILDIQQQAIKDRLAQTCDNQPFIARAPLVWIFLADYQRWYDYFGYVGAASLSHGALQKPGEADLLLACCDALIAAQTAVIAAESLGLGSCYIGDIMENYEVHRDLLELPRYTFPIGMLCMGYPTEQQAHRSLTNRFNSRYIMFADRYRQLSAGELDEMLKDEQQAFTAHRHPDGIDNIGQAIYMRKFTAAFSEEMRRSVRVMLSNWAHE